MRPLFLAMQIVTELHYFPSIPSFSCLLKADKIIVEANENFQKQTYRNRCYILSANGIKGLTIPILKTESKFIRDIRIDYSQKWEQIHCRSLQAAYGKSAFFEFYFPEFQKTILSKKQYLFDLNLELLSKCLIFLKVQKEMHISKTYQNEYTGDIVDKRNLFDEKLVYPCASLESDKYYFQAFGNVFVKHLSIIDLLFNEGTNAKEYLYHS